MILVEKGSTVIALSASKIYTLSRHKLDTKTDTAVNIFNDSLLLNSFTTAFERFSEFDAGNVILFQTKVENR